MKTVNYLCSIFFALSLLFGAHAVAEDAGAGGAGGPGGAGGGTGGGAGGAGGAGGQGGGNRQGNRGNFDPEQFRQRGLERIKETLGVNEEEWKALLPRVEAVQKLQSQARAGMFARRRPEVGNAPAAPAGDAKPAPEKSDVEKKTAELQTLVENKEADPEAVKTKTQELRDAREKARQELKKAQDELRAGLTPRQEAQLVLAGLLE